MEPLPTLAAALGRTAQATPVPSPPHGLFESELDRAVERAVEHGEEASLEAERAAEARDAAIRARRSERDASFERGGSEPGRRADGGATNEPSQIPVEGPRPQPPAPDAGEATSAVHGTPANEASAGPAAGEASSSGAAPPPSQPGVAVLEAPFQPGPQGVARAVAAGPAAVAPVATAAPPGAPTVESATATFLHSARGARAGGAFAAAATPTSDSALVDHAAEVLRQIRLAISPSAKRVVVDLHPDELGRLTIRMALHDGRVSALVRAESPQTLELLERHLPELRSVLAERGVEAGHVELELAPDPESREQGRSADRRWFNAPRSTRSAEPALTGDEPILPSLSRTPVDGTVDTYA